MKKIFPVTVLVLLGILLMYTTKPSSRDFDDYIDERYENADAGEPSGIHHIIRSGIDKTIAFQIKQTKQYQDKVLFALVSARELNEEVKFVGLMGMWFILN